MKTHKEPEGNDLKILILEDSIRDLELMCEQLSHAGYILDVTHVDHETGFTASLREISFDLILADFKLPGFDAFKALEISRELCPETPFICLSGTINEETAVDLLKLGAVDYVLKDKPEKLPFAVKRALEEAKVKSDHLKAIEALRKSEEKMRSIYLVAPTGIGVITNRVFKEVNPRICNMTGYTREEMLGENARMLYPSQEDYEFVGKEKYDQIREKGTGEVETRWQKKDGSIINVLLASTPIDRNDLSKGVTFTALDITERKSAEMRNHLQFNIAKEMIATNSLYELFEFVKNELNSILDTKNLFIALYDKETGMITAPFFKDEKDDFPEWPAEKTLTSYVIKKNQPLLLKKNDILNLHEKGIIELHGTISEVWIGVPLKVEGAILGAIVVQNYDNPDAYDQTSVEIMDLVAHELSMFIDRKRSEEKANKLSRAVEQSSVSVVITNREGVIEYVNPFFNELTGYSFEEAKGKKPSMLKSGHQSTVFYEELWGTILSGNNWEGEMLNRNKQGKMFWEKAVISPIVNNEGVITNFVGIKEDITERKKMLEDLVTAKKKAEESDKLKTAFLNNISHEIRTPLNGILGFGTFLTETNPSPEAKKEMLGLLEHSSKRLINTVTDYMIMAQIVSGTMEVYKKEFLLQPFFEEVIEEIRQLCVNKQIEFITNYQPDDAGLSLYSDPELIRKTLNALLDNALKFTSRGSIRCGFNLENGIIDFFVQDTGKGIAPEKLDSIFNMFMQENVSNTHGFEGSGLGLSIARGLVNLLGGSISVTSEKGKGSTFAFKMPCTATTITEKAPFAKGKNDTATGKPLVLVAEDEESNYMYMEMVLQEVGCDYLLAKNGEEAVACCEQYPDITLVLMDIKMPVMDGMEATKLIRKFRPDLPIIATTAYAQTGDEQRFLAAGCDGYLPKPIRIGKIMDVLRIHLKI